MRKVSLPSVVDYCDRLLDTSSIQDWEGAHNGLQVDNPGWITRIAAAVDASRATVEMALAANADLLVVHHGLFWTPGHPWTGKRYELIRRLIDGNLAVYSSHLPLDLHRQFGNNSELCRALKLRSLKPFFHEKGRYIGLRSEARMPREELMNRLTKVLARTPLLIPGGPTVCRKIGVVTGGAGSHLKTAAAEGVDTFITGEGPHWTFALAEELAINVFYGGHYATETFGVKALAGHLSTKFKVPWTFLDRPTGL